MLRVWLVFCFTFVSTLAQTTVLRESTCPVEGQSAIIQQGAQAMIGGIFSLRGPGTAGFGCGDIDTAMMQSYEAIRWALDRLNKKNIILNGQFLNDSYIPGVKLGMKVFDYCGQKSIALGSAQGLYPQFSAESRDCVKNDSQLMLGLVGASSSSVTVELNSFATMNSIPLVSPTSTATDLSNTEKFPYFMRTVPTDGPLMDAIVAFMNEVNWKYVVVIYTEDTYGEAALVEIKPRLVAADKCLTMAISTPSDDDSDSTIDRLLSKALSTEATGIIYLGSRTVARALLKRGEVKPAAGKLQWIFTDSISLSENFPNQKYPRGIISVLSGSRKIIEFEDHWVRIDVNNPSAENPWYKDWYMTENDCRLPSNTNPKFNNKPACPTLSEAERRNSFVQDQFVEPSVHAVFGYAYALRKAHQDKCNGIPGLCTALSAMTTKEFYENYLRAVDFTYTKEERVESLASVGLEPYNAPAKVKFDANGDIINPTYDIYNFNDYPGSQPFKFKRLGSHINGRLEIFSNRIRMYDNSRDTLLNPLPSSLCPSTGCIPCIGTTNTYPYMYQPGDVIINGIFTVHLSGIEPLRCGAFRKGLRPGAKMVEAMIYAIKEVNNRGILKNVKLGGLGFDDCLNPVLGKLLVSEVHQHSRTIMDSSNNALNPNTIDVYMGSLLYKPTIPLASLMNDLKRPLLGYYSSSMRLQSYPFYRYIFPSNYYTLKAIVLMLKRLGWNYVQAVQSNFEYYDVAFMNFKMLAAEEGICVVSHFVFGRDGNTSKVLNMLKHEMNVRPVFLLASDTDTQTFLTTVRVNNAGGMFHYFTHGMEARYLQGVEDMADGLWNVHVDPLNMQGFYDHLSRLQPNTYSDNPWFKEWYEETYNCSLDASNMRSYKTVCADSSLNPITNKISKSDVDIAASPVVAGVYAAAYALNETLKHYCGTSYSGICSNFLTAANKGNVLLQKIDELAFEVEAGKIFRMKDKSANFIINYQNFRNGAFIRVGSYNFETNDLSIQTGQVRLYGDALATTITPHCTEFCATCLYMFSNQNYLDIPGDVIIPAMFDVHYPGRLPYLCGDFRSKNGFQNTEAFKFAIERINSRNASVKLNPGVKLGGIGFDGCMDKNRASTLVSALYAGVFPLDNGRFTIPLQKFTYWLTYSNDFTIDTAGQQMGVVTPGATSPILDDKTEFKNFFRTIPSDSMIAKAMAQTAKTLGFEYIISLNAPEEGARESLEKFREYAKAEGICIGASYEFVSDGTMNQLIDYIVKSTSRVVAVFADPDRYIEDLLRAKSINNAAANIIFMANRVWSNPMISNVPSNLLAFAERSLMFGMPQVPISEFRNYLSNKYPNTYKENLWFYDYYQDFYKCNLGENWKYPSQCVNPDGRPITSSSGVFVEDYTVLPTIHAVEAIAHGVHKTLEMKCGVGYTHVCSKYLTDINTQQMINEFMDNMTYTDILNEAFRFEEREVEKGMKVFVMNNYSPTEQGTFDHLKVTLDATFPTQNYANIPAKCVGDCAVCYEKGVGTEKFTYFPADIMLIGLFDVHKKGPTPYTCGEINHKHGVQLVEAFHYAIEYVNSRSDILPRVTLGGIALDVCESPERAGNLVANIHSKNLELKNNENILDPARFDAYIGTIESESSIRVADVLNSLGIPQISYGATTLKLMDQMKYRYFIRTVPADDKQARAIVSFLKRFKLYHVQVIHSFDSVGEFGREEFSRLAFLNRICIAQNITVGRSGPVQATEARSALAQLYNKADAKVVILFVDDPMPFLEEIEKDYSLRSAFRFIGTDKWGEDPDIWNGLENIKRNRTAVTFDIETADLPLFDKYLEDKTPDTYTFNPWFNEYYELVYNCSLSSGSKVPCPTRKYGIPRAKGYIQDRYVLYVVNAVLSAAIGTQKAIEKLCPPDTQGLCNLFRTSGERRQEILNGAKQARFEDATQQPFFFTADGQSDRGYHIWESLQVPGQPDNYYLEDVGSYNDTHYLKIDARYDPNWYAPCDGVASCNCPFPEYQPSRYMLNASRNQLNVVYLSDIHESDPYNPYACGKIDTASNFQNLMAFFYALNLVNQYVNFPATLKLGGIALDTCSTTGRIGQDLYSLLSGEGICGDEGVGQVIDPSTIVVHLAKNSENAIATSSILSPLKITSMSQSATSVELSDKTIHNYFLRTVPPDNIQAIVMAEVITAFGWDYISAVYTENAYGKSAIKTFLENTAMNKKTCTTLTSSMKTDATIVNARSVIDSLNQRVGARVVVLFVTAHHARLLLQATSEAGLNQRFIWFGSDTWSNDMSVVKGYEDVALGALTIQIKSEIINNFKAFLKTLSFQNRHGLPDDWFEDIYQTLHQCRILTSSVRKTYTQICAGNEQVTDAMIPQDPYVLHTIISVFMIAQGLNRIDACKSSNLGIYSCLSLQENKLDLIYNGISGAQYRVLPNDLGDKSFNFRFTDGGYGDIGYNILNFRRDSATGQYEYKQIGTYQQELNVEKSLYQGSSFVARALPSSICPIGGRCLCEYANGTTYYQEHEGTPGVSYYKLDDGSYVNAQTGQVIQVENAPEIDDRFRDIWGIIVATLAGIGVFASLCVFIYLLVNYPFKSGTTVLGFMLSFGIVLMYAMVFAFIVHATEEVCGLRRFCLGLVYVICYSALFLKVIDCWRNKEKEVEYVSHYKKLGKPLGLFFVACLLVLIQCLINTEWLILESPTMERVIYNNMLWPRCMPDDFYDEGLVLSLVYIMVIICLSVILGLFSWKSTKNHREVRWILGIFALGIPVWVVSCVIATLGEYKMRDPAIAISLLMNATIMFVLGPLRRVYLLNNFDAKLEQEEEEHRSVRDSMYGRQYDNVGMLHDTNSMRGSMNVQEQMYYPEKNCK
ncbi:uncharacterized protein LOC133172311 isoform X1 [Saccostrea echinata]|uniref:uncharacterized protein LOC133172311 isoform X1 n=1 Tax=Saccostrea echinata TaxID=191078 RepID=UPI002A81A15B|nr:uncharacterized protein LOC133172311 isoform X1 [Saccostrea echinata]